MVFEQQQQHVLVAFSIIISSTRFPTPKNGPLCFRVREVAPFKMNTLSPTRRWGARLTTAGPSRIGLSCGGSTVRMFVIPIRWRVCSGDWCAAGLPIYIMVPL